MLTLLLANLRTEEFLGNNNDGMGGSITAGCMIYSFDPDP